MTMKPAYCLPLALFAISALAQPAPVEIDLRIGNGKYAASGQGECKAAPQASIHGVQATLHTVSHRSGNQSLNLTLWQPKNATPNMASLHVSTGSGRYEVDTVKGGNQRATKGSAKVTLEKAGMGGVFAIDAVAASGEKITGKIRCGRFGGIQAEGG